MIITSKFPGRCIDPWQFWLSIRHCQSEAEAESMIRTRDAALTLAAMDVTARQRDEAVRLLESALECEPSDRVCNQIRAALVCLEVVS